MLNPLTDGLRAAANLTRAGRLMDATATIQRHLGLLTQASPNRALGSIDAYSITMPDENPREAPLNDLIKERTPLRARLPAALPVIGKTVHRSTKTVVPNGAQFIAGVFANDAGSRPYKLYVPSGYSGRAAVPLIVMLHGCTQTPDDFAVGTRMNELAETGNFLVAYPAQTSSANMQKCWNWFNAADQGRGAGEPALIAGITRQVMAAYAVDARRVFVAGLSAGGAAAAIMGHAYPELYAGIGVHSGLACGAAHDLPSAFAAMRQGASGKQGGALLPTIVFHGDRDATVSPRNGDAIMSQFASGGRGRIRVEHGQVAGGHFYTRTVCSNAQAKTVAEHWVVRGAAHAWSGGSSLGSYTDPSGPDASAEMLRFFLEIAA